MKCNVMGHTWVTEDEGDPTLPNFPGETYHFFHVFSNKKETKKQKTKKKQIAQGQ